jgi:hypothetical protein
MTSLGAANVVTLSIGLAQELTSPGMRAWIVSVFLMIIFVPGMRHYKRNEGTMPGKDHCVGF